MDYIRALSAAQRGRDHRSKPIENNTRAEIIDEHTVGIRLHNTYVIRFHDDNTFELNSGGWHTVTTADRINSYAPIVRVGGRRIGKAPSRWWVWDGNRPLAPFFDGIRFDAEGTILNPQPEAVTAQAEIVAEATSKAIEKYLDVYLKAAKDQIYVDALTQEPDGAEACWDCGMAAAGKPEMVGRTTEGGDATVHLQRHVGRRELVPELAWAALKAKGYRDEGIALSGYMVTVNRNWAKYVRKALRDYLRSALITGYSGAHPVTPEPNPTFRGGR